MTPVYPDGATYELISIAMNNKAALLQLMEHTVEAYAFYKQALEVCSEWREEQKDTPGDASLNGLTYRASKIVNFHDPISLQLPQSITCSSSYGQDFVSLVLMYNLSTFSLGGGHNDGALQFLCMAMTMMDSNLNLTRSLHPTFMLSIKINLARINGALGFIQDAIMQYTEAIGIIQEANLGGSSLTPSIYAGFGRLLHNAGFFEDAAIIMHSAHEAQNVHSRLSGSEGEEVFGAPAA